MIGLLSNCFPSAPQYATVELAAVEDVMAGEHDTVFVGDVRLPEFKKLLNEAGMDADFSRGQLICNDRICVKKDKDGWIIDGPLCPDYYKVRDLLYKQFATV